MSKPIMMVSPAQYSFVKNVSSEKESLQFYQTEIKHWEESQSSVVFFFNDLEKWRKWQELWERVKFPENLSEFRTFSLPFEEETSEQRMLRKLQSAVRIYEREYGEEKKLDEAAMLASFRQVFRYFPELAKHNGEAFIDYETGCFGINYKETRSGRGTLILLIQAECEIRFSYAHKIRRIGAISGTARFSRELENSVDIRKLFQLMD